MDTFYNKRNCDFIFGRLNENIVTVLFRFGFNDNDSFIVHAKSLNSN